MTRVVLDASALLALIRNEPGADRVEAVQGRSVMSAVNIAEVAAKLCREGLDPDLLPELVRRLRIDIEAFDLQGALIAGSLVAETQSEGLSLGDRCCLALSRLAEAPVFTADRNWSRIAPAIGIEVVQIR